MSALWRLHFTWQMSAFLAWHFPAPCEHVERGPQRFSAALQRHVAERNLIHCTKASGGRRKDGPIALHRQTLEAQQVRHTLIDERHPAGPATWEAGSKRPVGDSEGCLWPVGAPQCTSPATSLFLPSATCEGLFEDVDAQKQGRRGGSPIPSVENTVGRLGSRASLPGAESKGVLACLGSSEVCCTVPVRLLYVCMQRQLDGRRRRREEAPLTRVERRGSAPPSPRRWFPASGRLRRTAPDVSLPAPQEGTPALAPQKGTPRRHSRAPRDICGTERHRRSALPPLPARTSPPPKSPPLPSSTLLPPSFLPAHIYPCPHPASPAPQTIA